MGTVVRERPTYVVIPFKDEIEMTLHVLGLCVQEATVSAVLLYDNGSSEEGVLTLAEGIAELEGTGGNPDGKAIEYFSTPDLSIYQMWNAGWQWVIDQRVGPFNIAFLNNDIDFIPGLITKMATTLRRREDALIIYPDYDRTVEQGVYDGSSNKLTHGTKKDGGMCGHCFITRGEAVKYGLEMFDEQFEWWCGDDDFARRVNAYPASQYRLVGWPCDHVNEATAGNGSNDWTHEAKGRDVERLVQKWGYF
jgi:hypothetical protein